MVLRFSHWPGTALFLIVSVFLLLVYSILFAFKNGREKLPATISHFTAFFWTTFLLFRIQHWDYYSWYPLGIAILISISWIAITIAELKQFKLPQILLSAYVIVNAVIAFVPPHHIFYLYNLNEVFYAKSRNDNYFAWDKYSWLLYTDHKLESALVANDNANAAWKTTKKIFELGDFHE